VEDRLIFGEKEFEFLRELVRRNVDFMIVGLSAAALQGAPVVTQDIDLWFRKLPDTGLEEALRGVGGIYVPSSGSNPPVFAGRGVELFDIVTHMHGIGEFEDEVENTINVPLGRIKVMVLKLERVIESKRATGREKDRRVLKVLSDALKTIREQK